MRHLFNSVGRLALLGLLGLLAAPLAGRAQLANYGASLSIGAGATLVVPGDFLNDVGSTFTNAGTLRVGGNTTANAAVSSAGGTLVLAGSTAQTLGGTADYVATDVQLNNAVGLTLATRLRVNGAMTFTSGILTAASAASPLTFGATGSVAGTPTDASHVRGYVSKEGTGAFTYPVGDGTRYQPVGTALTANSGGLVARYVTADAGAAPYTAGGTDATPLRYYNRFEYWDLAPVGTATGSVTVYFDNYKNPGITAVADLRVAHRSGGAWLNEGAAASSGTAAAGSVTGNAVSTWSPFALGSIAATSPLPVELTAFAAERQGEAARLSWATASEKNSAYFEAEASPDGATFRAVGRVAAQGSSSQAHAYELRDPNLLAYGAPRVYYRLRQVDVDGTATYSPVRALAVVGPAAAWTAGIWPNPVDPGQPVALHLLRPDAAPVRLQLREATGRLLGQRTVSAASALALPELADLPPGLYLFQVEQAGQHATLRVVRH